MGRKSKRDSNMLDDINVVKALVKLHIEECPSKTQLLWMHKEPEELVDAYTQFFVGVAARKKRLCVPVINKALMEHFSGPPHVLKAFGKELVKTLSWIKPKVKWCRTGEKTSAGLLEVLKAFGWQPTGARPASSSSVELDAVETAMPLKVEKAMSLSSGDDTEEDVGDDDEEAAQEMQKKAAKLWGGACEKKRTLEKSVSVCSSADGKGEKHEPVVKKTKASPTTHKQHNMIRDEGCPRACACVRERSDVLSCAKMSASVTCKVDGGIPPCGHVLHT